MLNLSFLILCVCPLVLSVKLSCRTETGSHVDWFVNYILPKLDDRSDVIGSGLGYAYFASNKRNSKWTISEKNISSPTSMLGYTLQEFYENQESLTYLLYNDDNPDSHSTAVGHAKGIVVFNEKEGFWIIHSIPKFAPVNKYSYPPNGIENGQSVLCISLATETLNEIGKELLYNNPSIYAKQLTISGLDEDVESLFSDKPNFITKGPFKRITEIKSRQGKRFKIFAKDNQLKEDLYSEIIAPELDTSLLVETWRRGSGTPFKPSCSINHQVEDVQSIDLAVSGKKVKNIRFSSMKDHSKWAISTDPGTNWICIGDINRMESQMKRGGGAACLENELLWKAFSASVNKTSNCNSVK